MKAMDFRGRWLLLTGASAGLGREMARILATEHGANLLLVARRQDRLDSLKAELAQLCSASVLTLRADLSRLEDTDRVLAEAARYPLYGAILNAGVTHFGPHSELDWDAFRQMLDTNVTSVVRMTNALLPLLERTSGGLLLVSSMAGIFPVPFQTAYSATKAFLVHFGCGLFHEYEGRPVSITTYTPGGVVSEMTAGESFTPLRRWLMPTDLAARQGIAALQRRKYLYAPGAGNRIASALFGFLPRRFSTALVGNQYRRALSAAKG
ncbi:MAG TPA: SDR family NAD(P)-dependent oxidoreductase [Polyangiaceae bacterium]|nr:SDR family NAD(P)-dependent oxidoreductase [Polyangiaceae bacterium]